MVLFLQNNEVETLRKLTKKVEFQEKKNYFQFFPTYLPGISGSLVNQDTAYSVRVVGISLKEAFFLQFHFLRYFSKCIDFVILQK